MSSDEEEELMMVEEAEASDGSDDAPIRLPLGRQSAVASSDFMRALPLVFKAACPPAADDASNIGSLQTLCFGDVDTVELDAIPETAMPPKPQQPPKVRPGPQSRGLTAHECPRPRALPSRTHTPMAAF